MTIGRQMDAAWKQAISAGLKASGKIGHTAKRVANAGGTKSAVNLGTIGAVKGAGVVGKAVGTAIGASKGLKYGIDAARGKKGVIAAHPIGGTLKAIKTNVKVGAKMGGFAYGLKSKLKVVKAADKVGVRQTLTKGLQLKR